ncbi:40S ribosomal protein S6 (nucleomorph) [Cryptomonas paramecium]|uniref:40S ribosomal protein S6 n=1 Tax=Cryptomonas paramaecium TaxID=2898 RepID=F2HHI9_9CRYP|nr:40S ribosomal protein S6 [Cryptomonas paramecium]AEA38785.1 40S ribosomal protein S6 [Cryptomonas paramecium]
MKINISDLQNKSQKTLDIEDENVLKFFYEKKIQSEFRGEILGAEWKGYILKINGGQDKQGFPMKPGVLTNRRIKALLTKNSVGCKGHHFKKGEKRKKSIRGCIISPETRVINVSVVKKHSTSDKSNLPCKKPLMIKRISKIRKMYSLSKGDDVKKYIIKQISQEKHTTYKSKFRKIQRMITPLYIQRKRFMFFKKKIV